MMRWAEERAKERMVIDPKELLPRRAPGHSRRGVG